MFLNEMKKGKKELYQFFVKGQIVPYSMIKKWKTISSKIAFDSPHYKIRFDTVKLPNGNVIEDYSVALLPDLVVVVGVTPSDQAILVREYKHGIQEVLTGFPAGSFQRGKEKPEDAAKREFREETGYAAENLEYLGRVYDWPTKDSNHVHVYYAPNAELVGEQSLDTTEEIEVLKHPFSRLRELVKKGTIQTAAAIAALVLAEEYRDSL